MDGTRRAGVGRGTPRRSSYEVLAVASRGLILDQVRDHPEGVDTATVARHTGLHANTVRFHLDVLVEAGLVTVSSEAASGPGRPRLRFSPARLPPPAPHGAPDLAPAAGEDGYALLAAVLLEHLGRSDPDPGAAAEAAGRSWSPDRGGGVAAGSTPTDGPSDTAAVAEVAALLDDLGFAPETVRDRDGWRILLHRCPFHDLAAAHPEIVCRLHLGLLQGAVNRLGRPADGVRLQPFVAPGLCEAFVPAMSLRQRPTN